MAITASLSWAGGGYARAPAVDAQTPQQRIEAATVEPPGGDCVPDPGEDERVEAATRARLHADAAVVTAETLSTARTRSAAFWGARREELLATLRERSRLLRQEVTESEDGRSAALDQEYCLAWARRSPEVCASVRSKDVAWACRALMVGFASELSRVELATCPPEESPFGPLCLYFVTDDRAPCARSSGAARMICDALMGEYEEAGPICTAPFRRERCLFQLAIRGAKKGVVACDEAVANAGLDPVDSQRLLSTCLATVTGEPEHCRVGRFAADRGGGLAWDARAVMYAEPGPVSLLAGVAANSPVVCALEIVIRDDQGEVVDLVRPPALWPSRSGAVITTRALDARADPFRHRVGVRSACVPAPHWR